MRTYVMMAAVLGLIVFTALPTHAGWNPFEADTAKNPEVQATVDAFIEADPDLKRFFDEAHGFAIFPTVGKGGIGIGGAYGKGEVFEQGKLIGHTKLKQVTIGFQLGGQAYREIIFFEDKVSLDHFKKGNFEMGAQASAVAVTLGASADADYDNGVAVFTVAKGGLMYEASIAGQKFSFQALK